MILLVADAGCSILDKKLIFKILSRIQYPESSINKLTAKKFIGKQKITHSKNIIFESIA